MSSERLLPIKVVIPHGTDYLPDPGGGGGFEPLGPVTDDVRAALSAQVRQVQASLATAFATWQGLPGVAMVRLKDEALAKSKRPTEVLSPDTCPVIGCNTLGELYISVTPQGLRDLDGLIRSNRTKRGVAHLSTIEAIEPFRATDAVPPELLAQAPGPQDATPRRLRCRLFRHESSAVNAALDGRFKEFAAACGVGRVTELDYADGIRVFALDGMTAARRTAVQGFVGLQKLDAFPGYRIVRTMSRILGNLNATRFPPPTAGRTYPVVGLIDSGTDPANAALQQYVAGRLDLVPRSQQDNDHGSFVGGLLANGRALNHNDPRFPDAPCKIVDVVAIDRDGEITEYDLLTAIDTALDKWPEVRVWNLSLGLVGRVCQDHEFSELGAALDERMRRRDVLFVIAAGNYTDPPFRGWPPDDGLADRDRIAPPADALRGLTVGSVAHLGNPACRVQADEPSPFTRRGPGPAYALKPELSFPGGNCDPAGEYVQAGVVSLDGRGNLAENIGTSFATPLAAAVAAHVFHELDADGELTSPALVKGLMVHAAFLKNGSPDADGVRYLGLGSTPDPTEVVHCVQSAATLVVQATVKARKLVGKRPFPIPPCLKSDAGLQCEIFMTLLYDPPLDRQYGVEYCRCNVTASLGTVAYSSKKGKDDYTREVNPAPDSQGSGFEKDLVKHGYKWSPLKLYHRRMDRGPADKRWRLTLEMLNRAEHAAPEQNAVLLITIRGADDTLRVYDELVQEMNRQGWAAQDLKLRSRQRLQ